MSILWIKRHFLILSRVLSYQNVKLDSKRLLGKFTATLSNSEKYDVADIYVVQGTHNVGSLLGSRSATALGILRIVNRVACDDTQKSERNSTLKKQDPSVLQTESTSPVTSVCFTVSVN